MSVHDVHMNAVRSSTLGLDHLFAQAGEIGREDRWSELDFLGRHIAPLSWRYRRIRLLVELSWPSLGSLLLSSSGMMRWASTLPSSTPHRSNESMSQIVPWVNTLCSYIATSFPSAAGVNRSNTMVFDGRLPSKTRCGTSQSGVPSALTCSRVFPKASASVCANTLASNMS